AVAVSGNASAIGVGATGALSFNDISNTIEATVRNTNLDASGTVAAGGAVSVTASDHSSIDAIAVAATAAISGSTTSTSVGVSIGLALAHNKIDKDVAASILNVPSVLTGGGDVTVTA